MANGANNIAVQIRDLHKGFGSGATRIEVLHGINLDAYAGEILLLVGPSGCGKTTLLTLMSGLLDPDSGSVNVFGEAVDKMSGSQKTKFRERNLGFVFQQFNLLPTLNAAENAAIPLLIKGENRAKAVAVAEEFLRHVNLGHRMKAYPSQLSGGEQQRVAIARALVAAPKLLVCDEPTASLDGETGHTIMELLRAEALKADRCVLIVTHDNRVFHYGDRMARMVDGRIVSVEPIDRAAAAKPPSKLALTH